MGLFDFFNSKDKAAEQEKIIEEQKEKDHQSVVEAQKEAHEGLVWPTVPRLNILNMKDTRLVVDDPLTQERKDEIGPLIYEPDLTPEMIQDLSVQELLFLQLAQTLFNRKSPLQNYEKNNRVIHNEFLGRLHNTEKFYVLYDKRTGYPLIDGGYVVVYLEKDRADKAVDLYKAQFRDPVVLAQPGEAASADEKGNRPMSLFDYLYYLGAENIVVDNGWYKGLVKRSEMSAPMDWNSDPKNTPPTNPDLVFAMTDYVGEMRWPVKYEKRDEVIRRKTDRMMALIPRGRYIVPSRQSAVDPEVGVQHPGPDGKPATQQVQFPAMKIKDRMYLPVFTDLFEFGRQFGKTDMRPAGFDFRALVRLLTGPMQGLIINPNGQGILVPKAKAESLLFTANGSSQSGSGTASANAGNVSGSSSAGTGAEPDSVRKQGTGAKVVNFAEMAKKNAEKQTDPGSSS